MSKDVDIQRKQVFEENFKVTLKAACTVGEGVLRLSAEEEESAITSFDEITSVPTFFIPASGSGSRMFQFLFEWADRNNGEAKDDLNSVFETLSKLAVAENFLDNMDSVEEFTSKMLGNIACKPKGLIPFHKSGKEVYTAFQEHVRQVKKLFPNSVNLHFTVQESFEEEIKANIKELQESTAGVEISFSHQNSLSDAHCFRSNRELFYEEGKELRRPSGHGTLLENLNALPGELVFIKNIDNIQHETKAGESMRVWKIAAGLLKNFEQELRDLAADYTQEGLRILNEKYEFLSKSEEGQFNEETLHQIISRPTRVCGMVKNEGEPGGGPFWIKDGEIVTKQIIEKVQISEDKDQQKIVEASSHFNPVFMVVSKADIYGNPLNLNDFRDDSKFFVVKKTHKGEEVTYRELPGLWNGSMSNWNTLFLEIPSEVFSPVKTILDLAKPAHIA